LLQEFRKANSFNIQALRAKTKSSSRSSGMKCRMNQEALILSALNNTVLIRVFSQAVKAQIRVENILQFLNS